MAERPSWIEKIAIDSLSNVSPEMVSPAVQKRLDLADILGQHLGYPTIQTIRLATSFLKNDGHLLTADNIIKWLQLQRPDLALEINKTQENYKWFVRQISSIKRLFGI